MLIFNAISFGFALAGLSITSHIHLAALHGPTCSPAQPCTLDPLHLDPVQ